MSEKIEELKADTAEAVEDTETEIEVDVDENEPVFFNPKSLNLVASSARIISWIVLVGFVATLVNNVLYFIEVSQGTSLAELFNNANARMWMFSNLITPVITGATFFVLLQGVCNVIDALFEVDFNTREAK